MTSPDKVPDDFPNKENICISGEEEKQSDEKLMKEYYGIYGKQEEGLQGEMKPLSENDISNQIDKEISNDKQGDDLE